MRLKTMAALRAPTMAPRMSRICRAEGGPSDARIAPVKANGRANSVCWNLIIDSVAYSDLATPAAPALSARSPIVSRSPAAAARGRRCGP
jgi:hypothetical protein